METLHFPEAFLRRIWQDQTFTTSDLSTTDGKRIEILSPGVPNRDAGPDFRNARIRIGTITYRGDVEFHTSAEEWEAHHHDADPHYNGVILHVVLAAEDIARPAVTASRRRIPLLVLHPYLDEILRSAWTDSLVEVEAERPGAIPCNGLNDHVPAEVIFRWVTRLAYERIEFKVRRFEDRLKRLVDESKMVLHEPYPRYYGNPDEIPLPHTEYHRKDFAARWLWEQLLFEGIMEGMGYAKNRSPFLILAQSMRLQYLKQHGLGDRTACLALLFGAAGLLPSSRSLREKESRVYVRLLRRIWQQHRPGFTGAVLHEADWLFFRLRPSNFPTARLAAISHLLPSLFGEESFRRLIGVFKREGAHNRMRELHDFFRFEPDDFWKHHYRFQATRGTSGIALGADRINDIVTNAILPIVLLYARMFKDHTIRTNARNLLARVPASAENSITKALQQQLFKAKGTLDSSLRQQGAIQLYKFYCSSARCAECEVGKRTSLRSG